MKTKRSLIEVCLLGAMLLARPAVVTALTITDNFTNPASWGTPLTSPGANISIGGGRMNYTSSTTNEEFAGIPRNGPLLPTTQDWSLKVDVHVNAFTLTTNGHFTDVFLGFGKTGDWVETHVKFEFDRGWWSDDGPGYDIAADVNINGLDTPDLFWIQNLSSPDATLRMDYDAATRSITYYFNDVPQGTANLASGTYNLGMSDSDTFTIFLIGSSERQIVTTGEAYLSNLQISMNAIMTGHVYCSCDDSPVTNAFVQITNALAGSFSATTDSSGSYSITNLPEGIYFATVSQANYYSTNSTIMIPSDASSITTNFTLKPNGQDIAALNVIVPMNSISPFKVKNIGTIDSPNRVIAPDGNALLANFTPGLGLTLEQAACRLGFDHFNWVQLASGDSYKGQLYNCPSAPVTSYFLDPPDTFCDGTPYCIYITPTYCENADNILGLYYNEGPAFPGKHNITNQVSADGTVLRFYDQPSLIIANDVASFMTFLVGVNDDKTPTYLGRQFSWQSTFNGTHGQVNILAASQLGLTNGNGGIGNIQTNIQPANIPPEAIALLTQIGGVFLVTIQPTAEKAAIGGTATFTLFPTNSSSLNCQWRKGGVNLSGKTNYTLTLNNLTTNDTGIYDAVLSDTNGSIASAVATLTVLTAPLFQSPLVTTNGQFVLSWIAAQGKNYQLQYKTNLNQADWLNLGSPIPASNNLLSVTNPIGSDKQRFYRVQQLLVSPNPPGMH